MAARRKKAAKKASKKKAARRGAKKAVPAAMIISKSRTKDVVSSMDCKTAGDFYDALDGFVREALAKAVERAKENKRATVRPQDL
jgi:histone H3/H4